MANNGHIKRAHRLYNASIHVRFVPRVSFDLNIWSGGGWDAGTHNGTSLVPRPKGQRLGCFCLVRSSWVSRGKVYDRIQQTSVSLFCFIYITHGEEWHVLAVIFHTVPAALSRQQRANEMSENRKHAKVLTYFEVSSQYPSNAICIYIQH